MMNIIAYVNNLGLQLMVVLVINELIISLINLIYICLCS